MTWRHLKSVAIFLLLSQFNVLIYVNTASAVIPTPEERVGSIRIVSSMLCQPLRLLSDCGYLIFAQVCLLILIKAQERPGSASTPYVDQTLANTTKRGWILCVRDLIPNYF